MYRPEAPWVGGASAGTLLGGSGEPLSVAEWVGWALPLPLVELSVGVVWRHPLNTTEATQ